MSHDEPSILREAVRHGRICVTFQTQLPVQVDNLCAART